MSYLNLQAVPIKLIVEHKKIKSNIEKLLILEEIYI